MYLYEITFDQLTEHRDKLAEEARRQRLAAGLRGERRARLRDRLRSRQRTAHTAAAREAAAPS